MLILVVLKLRLNKIEVVQQRSVRSLDMWSMILETLFSITLFFSGGHLMSTNFKIHHFSDGDSKDIWFLKHNNSTTKHCTKHSELEHIKKMRTYHNDQNRTIYKVTKNDDKEILEETLKEGKS